jgi:2',3'-cyclic-nucleotide 2'-phosphodiesterase (5'-nucleotidase family)
VPCLHLFHTNDFHGKLTDALAERLKSEFVRLAGSEPWLYLDAGDAIAAGNIGVSLLGEPILDRMTTLGCVAMALGNREFHFSRPLLEKKIDRARFPVLSANARPKGASDSIVLQKSITLEIAGKRTAIFGLTVPMVTEKMAARAISDFLFDDAIVIAKQVAQSLRADADVLIALTHIGIAQDRRLAEAVPELDLIIGGHTHVVLETPERVNSVPIVQAGSHARYFGHLIVSADGSIMGKLYPLAASLTTAS